jgi:hypothetical protein
VNLQGKCGSTVWDDIPLADSGFGALLKKARLEIRHLKVGWFSMKLNLNPAAPSQIDAIGATDVLQIAPNPIVLATLREVIEEPSWMVLGSQGFIARWTVRRTSSRLNSTFLISLLILRSYIPSTSSSTYRTCS